MPAALSGNCLFVFAGEEGGLNPAAWSFQPDCFGCLYMCGLQADCASGAFAERRKESYEGWLSGKGRVACGPEIPLDFTSLEDDEMTDLFLLGFGKALPDMSKDELKEKLAGLRSVRKARAEVRRETKKKRGKEVDELSVMLRALPKEAQGDLEALLKQFGG